MNKRQLLNITENVVKRLIKEGLLLDEEGEVDGFEDYENGYPNSNFNPSIDRQELLDFCRNSGDFLFIASFFGRTRINAANSSEIIDEICNDIQNTDILEPTHKYDYLLEKYRNEFEDYYVSVMMINDVDGNKYAIVYMQQK